jgi:uncharacterized protein (DUF1499 family)
VNRRRLLLSIPALLAVCLGIASCMSSPATSGPVGNRLPACPDSPNCVCSQDTALQAAIAPLPLTGPTGPALERLRQLVLAQPRTVLADQRPDYLRFEFRSRIFRFVDDVEFLADPASGVIHVRSASRTGHSDLGVNRRRIELLRTLWTGQPAATPSATR